MITSWEKIGNQKGQSLGLAKGKAEGKAEGRAETLVNILIHRFGSVTDSDRKVVLSVTDIAKLDHAVDLALDAKAVKEVVAFLKKKK